MEIIKKKSERDFKALKKIKGMGNIDRTRGCMFHLANVDKTLRELVHVCTVCFSLGSI